MLDWAPYIAIGVFILGFFVVMGLVTIRQRNRAMALAMVEDCGVCGAEVASAKARCEACDWDPAYRQDPEVGPLYEAYGALSRAIDDSISANDFHAAGNQAAMLPGRQARAYAAEAHDMGFRSEIDAMDAVEQALTAVPELRGHVDGITDPFNAALKLSDLLRQELRRVASERTA